MGSLDFAGFCQYCAGVGQKHVESPRVSLVIEYGGQNVTMYSMTTKASGDNVA